MPCQPNNVSTCKIEQRLSRYRKLNAHNWYSLPESGTGHIVCVTGVSILLLGSFFCLSSKKLCISSSVRMPKRGRPRRFIQIASQNPATSPGSVSSLRPGHSQDPDILKRCSRLRQRIRPLQSRLIFYATLFLQKCKKSQSLFKTDQGSYKTCWRPLLCLPPLILQLQV